MKLPAINLLNNIFSTNSNPKAQFSKPAFKGSDTFEKSITIKGSETEAKIYTAENIDYKTLNQVKSLCNHPAFKEAPIRIMPDVHPSANTIVGFSAPIINDKVIPNIIGGDIGCGILCIKINTQGQNIDYVKLDEIIKTYNSTQKTKLPNAIKKVPTELEKSVEILCKKLYKANPAEEMKKLGTVGGGNHFVEIDADKNGQKYLVIHTGSRSLGKKVADYYSYLAKHQNRYEDINLSFLTGEKAEEYLQDLKIAQEYAKHNRRVIANEIITRMGWKEIESFESVHNFIDEKNIVRKGAIPAYNGQQVIIPLNMKDGAIIGKGKGNIDWNCTAPHGAGRKIARGEAKRVIAYEDFKTSMDGIYTSCVSLDTLDEAPAAYKKPEEIIENIGSTVDIEEIIKPVYNYKD